MPSGQGFLLCTSFNPNPAIQGVGQTELGTNLGKRPPASTEECAKQMLPVPAPGLQASWVKVCQKHYGFDLYPHS